LQHPKYIQKYSVLWQGLRTNSKVKLFYSMVFIMRRSLVCFQYLLLVNYNYFQVQIATFVNLLIMEYVGI
jgi:hypothetical protein